MAIKRAAWISPMQCKMALAGLRITRRSASSRAKMSPDTLQRFLRYENIKTSTRQKLQKMLERAGAIFDKNDCTHVQIKSK